MANLRTYAYKAKPARTSIMTEGPTPDEAVIIDGHRQYLRELTESGIVVFAGHIDLMDDTAFALVVFKAENNEAAHDIMMGDPVVKNGIFESEVYPFTIVEFGKL